MITWFKKLNRIVKGYNSDLANAHARIANLEKLLKDSTDIAVDVGLKGPCQVIAIGRYRNADYVQAFSMNVESFEHLIGRLREIERYGTVSRIDAPYSIRNTIVQEFRRM